ncbi:hypothetical protein [Gemmobacter sp. 24YEA27]|uniref:hypothetical protein n=1 Tax=Gemmobacter sp. 24YEA27 TaxID=3040672 RepID=UPI0024B39F86|nr:hypothetical protein [Gemmobacter sp. 24YEA27]
MIAAERALNRPRLIPTRHHGIFRMEVLLLKPEPFPATISASNGCFKTNAIRARMTKPAPVELADKPPEGHRFELSCRAAAPAFEFHLRPGSGTPQPLRRQNTQHQTISARAENRFHLSDTNTITA